MVNKLNMPKSLKLGNGRLPRPISGLIDWALAVDLVKIVQTVLQGDVTVTETKIPFKGVVIPMKTEEIALKPTEQQSWEWLYVFTFPNVILANNDRIVYNETTYKVMDRRDYSAYGHVEYHIVKDWQK